MKNLLLFIVLISLNSCLISNSSLNDNNSSSTDKAKNAKLVATNPSVGFLRNKYLDNGTSIRVYSSYLANEPIDAESFNARFTANYAFMLDITREKNALRPIAIADDAIQADGNTVSFYFDLPKPKSDLNVVSLQIELIERVSNFKATNEVAVRLNSTKTSDQFGVFGYKNDQLLIKNYANASDSIVIKSLDGKDQDFKLVRYKHEFDPALSPIAVGVKPPIKPLYVDTLYDVKANVPFVLAEQGLYYFIKDTTDRTGFTILATDNRFPKYTKPASLTKPMVYLTTNQEFQNLNATSDYKKAFDQFWLGLYSNNQNAARKTIKSFYTKVEDANKQFTSYKEGWKTDKGMVYIILGKPDIVRFLKDKEIWVYTKNEKYSEVNFIFVKRSNQFIEDHFELNRFAEFQQFWYSAITNWRLGQM
jgi:GWxTD domain-containing protein